MTARTARRAAAALVVAAVWWLTGPERRRVAERWDDLTDAVSHLEWHGGDPRVMAGDISRAYQHLLHAHWTEGRPRPTLAGAVDHVARELAQFTDAVRREL